MQAFGKTLRQLRRQAGYTQKEVAVLLSRQLRTITHQAVSKWETGDAQPGVFQFLALCRLYGVGDVLGTFCPRPKEDALNAEGQGKLREYEELLLASGLYRQQVPQPAWQAKRCLPLYDLPASAGTGQFLDGDDHQLVEVDGTVPQNADFGVRLAGDSMAPRYANGQVVWVHRQQTMKEGEIGLFLYDGQAYCKQLTLAQGGPRLVSLNAQYPPIDVAHPEELRVFGTVVN